MEIERLFLRSRVLEVLFGNLVNLRPESFFSSSLAVSSYPPKPLSSSLALLDSS